MYVHVTDGPRTYSLAPAGTGEMYVSIVWDGECTLNVPGIAPITEAGGGQLIVKINEACTEGLWYSYIGGDVDGGQLAVDFATGDILGAVRWGGWRGGGTRRLYDQNSFTSPLDATHPYIQVSTFQSSFLPQMKTFGVCFLKLYHKCRYSFWLAALHPSPFSQS